jgi:hypothetical protein
MKFLKLLFGVIRVPGVMINLLYSISINRKNNNGPPEQLADLETTWRRQAVYASGHAMPPWSINDEVGMVQTKLLRYVTVPANRFMCCQHLPNVLQLHLIPGNQFPPGALKRWLVVYPVQVSKRSVTVDAAFSVVPSH